MKPTILIADDEPDVLRLVGNNFQAGGFNVLAVADGTAAIELASLQRPALIVLDIMMPGLTGLEVTRILKRNPQTSSIPIILLSARHSEADRVVGLELGADDFVAKPFSPRELVLRARAILQRKTSSVFEPQILGVGAIEVDQDRHEVRVEGRAVPLTPIEFKLISVLSRETGRVFVREALLREVWGDEFNVDDRTIDTHVRRLREKLGFAAAQIKTVRGFGYRLDHAVVSIVPSPS